MPRKCAMSSIGTGTSTGPASARPTKAATSMRGNASGVAGGTRSMTTAGRVMARSLCRHLHLDVLAGQHDLLDRDVAALAVERGPGVLHRAGVQQLPLEDRG